MRNAYLDDQHDNQVADNVKREQRELRKSLIETLVKHFGCRIEEIGTLPYNQLKWMYNTRRYEIDKLDEATQ